MELSKIYPITLICNVLDYPRSSFYYEPVERDERDLKAAIVQVAGEWPTYGYRRITAQLRRQGLVVNSKRVRRLMKELGVTGKRPVRRRRTTNSEHSFPRYPNLVHDLDIVRPNQVWVSDISYIRLMREFVYLAVIMDVFTRVIRGWHLSRALDQSLTSTALKRALEWATPEIHHSDQGVQYAASDYVQMLTDAGTEISMTDAGQAWQNGYAERVIRTIKEEEVDLSEYQDYHDAYRQIQRFIEDVYVHKRIHSALGYLTPAEFEEQWLMQHSVDELVH